MKLTQLNSIDCSQTTSFADLESDIVIVGSGAGGGISAEILTQAGLTVIIVEEGGLKTAADFELTEKQAYAELYQEMGSRQTQDKAIQILQGKCVGGSTTVNWTSSFRTPEQTLNHWKQAFGLQGLLATDLNPWFAWVENKLNISPWALPPNQNNELLSQGLKKLGWSFGTIARNVKGCANLGYCGMGCPIDAKQSMLVSCIPNALSRGAQLLSRAQVKRVLVNGGEASGVEIQPMDSLGQARAVKPFKIKAKRVILAAGAIGTPAILMRSKIDTISPELGARTFLHPVTASVAKMPHQVNAFQGAPQSIYSDHFLWRDGVTQELGFKMEVPPLHPVLAATLLRHHGAFHQQLMQDFPFYQANISLLRDGFNEQSSGGKVSLDKFGHPQLDYPLTPLLWRGLKAAMLANCEVQFAAGAAQVMPLHMDAQVYSNWQQAKLAIENLPAKKIRWQIVSAHVMGGCGMSEKSNHGVCNSEGELKGVSGVSVFDGSLFPTSLGVNPQLSIYAIVAKLAFNLALKHNRDFNLLASSDGSN
ncbi:GMC family oxidoreductase N-terminal domain-containing protein [Aliikangiella sp. IMCC44653]